MDYMKKQNCTTLFDVFQEIIMFQFFNHRCHLIDGLEVVLVHEIRVFVVGRTYPERERSWTLSLKKNYTHLPDAGN